MLTFYLRNYPGPFSGWRCYCRLPALFFEQAWKVWVWIKNSQVLFFFLLLVQFFTVWVFACRYVEKYDLKEPSDDIQHVLKRIAVKLGKTQRVKAITGIGEKQLDLPFHLAYSVFHLWKLFAFMLSVILKLLCCLYSNYENTTSNFLTLTFLDNKIYWSAESRGVRKYRYADIKQYFMSWYGIDIQKQSNYFF